MLCVRTHQHQSGKSTDRLIIQHIFKQLIAGAVRYGMVDHCIIVHMFVLIGNSHTAQVYFGTLAGKRNFRRITGRTVMQGHAVQ